MKEDNNNLINIEKKKGMNEERRNVCLQGKQIEPYQTVCLFTNAELVHKINVCKCC